MFSVRTNIVVAMIASGCLVAGASGAWIIPSAVTASSEQSTSDKATFTIDGSGLSAENSAAVHSAGSNRNWSFAQGNGIQTQNESITFDLGASYNLTGTYVWQFTRATFSNETNRGVSQFDILVSNDNVNFAEVVSNATLNRANPGTASSQPTGNEPAQFKSLAATKVRYVQFGIDSTFEGSTSDFQGGFAEVRFEGTLVPEPASIALLALGGMMLGRRRRD